ncbi:hypothetical protein [Nocardia wallacei]|uniref:MmyB family transcriptional regulator n=1 Tax=Nocardia wallacei TaxID=480035 RepID=UPI0024569759|nr:hypothetical protein [Nocardia wallacei]
MARVLDHQGSTPYSSPSAAPQMSPELPGRPVLGQRGQVHDRLRALLDGPPSPICAAYARYPGNRALAELVTELLGTAPRFARMWSEHEVEVRRGHRKNVRHPVFGPLEFECQVLHISDTDQRMILYCADPGSPADAVFRRIGSAAGAPAS